MSYRDCSAVTPSCPVEATTYGYYPNFGGNVTLLAVFGVLTIAQCIAGLTRRVYAYTGVVAAGCLLETLGYAGRLMMNKNPWSDSGTKLQIICLIIAPSFIAAGVYLTLKHVVLHNGPEYSRLRPSLYTWIFIGCDLGSICLQAIGGGLAAAAGKTNRNLLNAGNNIIITGIAFQVVTMIVCGALAAEYAFKRRRGRKLVLGATDLADKSTETKAQIFQSMVALAYLTVLIRCIYRLPEMAGGWGNPRMRNEKEFLLLDGLMIALASIALTVFHPGYFYQNMRTGKTTKSKEIQMSSRDESENGVVTPVRD